MAAGPVSRILSALRRDGHSSRPRITARLKRPTRRLWRAEPARAPGAAEALPRGPSLFGLAPCGACPARRITATAVRSYRTFSPLPGPCSPGGMFSVALPSNQPTLAKNARAGHPPGRYPAHCSAEFGLSSRLATSDRPVRLPADLLYSMVSVPRVLLAPALRSPARTVKLITNQRAGREVNALKPGT